MRSPALAIGWQLWGQNRPLIVGCLSLLLGTAVSLRLLPASYLESKLLMGQSVALCGIPFLFLMMFLYPDLRLGGKVPNRGYPPRMFTLPVRAWQLALWPMIYGMATLVLVWVALVVLIYRPLGMNMPLGLPALVMAATLTFLQAVAWSPFGSPLVRAAVVILGAPLLVAGPIWAAVIWELGEVVYWAVLPFYIAASYVVAVLGVAHDRSSGGVGWASASLYIERLFGLLPRRSGAFGSPARAQLWFEWRGKGLVLPFLTGLLLMLFMVLVVGLAWSAPEKWLPLVLFVAAILPMVWTGAIGGGLAKNDFWAPDVAISPFLAAKPATCGDLVAAKLKTSALSVLLMMGSIALMLAVWIVVTGNVGRLAALWGSAVDGLPPWKRAVLAPLAIAGLYVMTWKGVVGSLTVTLTGRRWFINTVTLSGALFVSALFALGFWAFYDLVPGTKKAVLAALPWVVGALVGAKAIASALVVREVVRRGLMSARLTSWLVGLWALAVGCLVAPVLLVLPRAGLPVGAWVIAAGVVLNVPLARLAAAPLALEWNRHR